MHQNILHFFSLSRNSVKSLFELVIYPTLNKNGKIPFFNANYSCFNPDITDYKSCRLNGFCFKDRN